MPLFFWLFLDIFSRNGPENRTALALSCLKCSTAFSSDLNAPYAHTLKKFRSLKMVSQLHKNIDHSFLHWQLESKRSLEENLGSSPWDAECWHLSQRDVPGAQVFSQCWMPKLEFTFPAQPVLCSAPLAKFLLGKGRLRILLIEGHVREGAEVFSPSLGVPVRGGDHHWMDPACVFCEVSVCPCWADQWEEWGRCTQVLASDLDSEFLLLSRPMWLQAYPKAPPGSLSLWRIYWPGWSSSCKGVWKA